jgi:hypothetical protein
MPGNIFLERKCPLKVYIKLFDQKETRIKNEE